MTTYITSIEVMVMHRTLIERYGGSPGLRDGHLEMGTFRMDAIEPWLRKRAKKA